VRSVSIRTMLFRSCGSRGSSQGVVAGCSAYVSLRFHWDLASGVPPGSCLVVLEGSCLLSGAGCRSGGAHGHLWREGSEERAIQRFPHSGFCCESITCFDSFLSLGDCFWRLHHSPWTRPAGSCAGTGLVQPARLAGGMSEGFSSFSIKNNLKIIFRDW